MSEIEIVNGEKAYIKNKEKIKVLENLNLKFEKGKLYAIMGESGSGKTTFLNIIGTLDNFTSGKLLIEDKDISHLKEDEKANIRMRKIGFIFQEFYLNPNMTVEENIEQPMYINDQYDKEMIKSRTNELIETVGLSHRKKHFPRELSGGEQQRVAIARALANKPDIILADEPTGNLDRENETKTFEMLKILSQNNKCVIVVSHSSKIEQYADVLLKIKEGNIEINEIS